TKPDSIPAIAPSLFIRVENIPMMITGKNDAAAKPKAKATTSATNPGGLTPKYPAIPTAPAAAIRAIHNSRFSVIVGRSVLPRSPETAVDITNQSPAAVDKAAANPPAAPRPTTQLGSLASAGAASTMISVSMTISLVASSGV